MTYPLAPVARPERFVALPMHVIGYSACLNCGQQWEGPVTREAYEAYVTEWYATEYEGPVYYSDGGRFNPEPESFEDWAYLRQSCLGSGRLDPNGSRLPD